MIDEVQHAPDLLIAIKQRVDRDPRPAQFLLTSSTNILMAPKIADALTGRAEYYGLWPLTQGELWCAQEKFIETLFRGAFPQMTGAMVGRKAHASMLVAGGFPESQQRAARRRILFFESYLVTLIESDLSSIARVHHQTNVRPCSMRRRPPRARCSTMTDSAATSMFPRARSAHTPTYSKHCS